MDSEEQMILEIPPGALGQLFRPPNKSSFCRIIKARKKDAIPAF